MFYNYTVLRLLKLQFCNYSMLLLLVCCFFFVSNTLSYG